MRLQFVMSEIGVGLRRNLTMTFAVIVSVALSLALAGGSWLGREQVTHMKGYWYDKVEVSIFLCNKVDVTTSKNCADGPATAQQRSAIAASLKSNPLVDKFYVEDPAEAYVHYKQQFAGQPGNDLLTPDQMEYSFRVKLKDPNKFDVITTRYSNSPGVIQVQDQRALLQNLFGLLNGMTYVALAVLAFMLTVAMLLIVNTVRVSAFSRRRETGIMRLVGASGFYIQAPFIMEAAFAGLIGGLLACGMLLTGRYFLVEGGLDLQDKIKLIQFLGWGDVIRVLPLVLVVGILMPSLAAFFTLRKYLRV
ncbi:permease-like cell division protein FtsX [Streptomyces sp. SL13]|jgi:cell division transport system permease protein|uniref:Cell division protein FtsX n=1 Tax=Streptantibioticus silvisoli TaxID=2705255 RepID=A0AA90HBF2_9ACTN|nr:permease-like cell division protein FtsX [Streptantibioticus silvisoli]MDI5965974.1 permease-like cell division protein FtsX [Streptantibioticus silvisoli]MDI5972545.1 permease-like cell division protein FtsX [Streptantibioticus silvisoli]